MEGRWRACGMGPIVACVRKDSATELRNKVARGTENLIASGGGVKGFVGVSAGVEGWLEGFVTFFSGSLGGVEDSEWM